MSDNKLNMLLEQQKILAEQEAKIKAELKEKKQILQREFSQNIDDVTREKILNDVKQEAIALKHDKETLVSRFKKEKESIKARGKILAEKIALVNYVSGSTQGIGNGKVKNQISLENDIVSVLREGFPEIKQNVSVPTWQKELKQKILDVGIGDGIARNVCYNVSCMLKAKNS